MCVGLQGFLCRKAVWIAASPPYKCDRIVSFQVFEPSLEPKESPKEKQKTQDKSWWKWTRLDYVRLGMCLVMREVFVLSYRTVPYSKMNKKKKREGERHSTALCCLENNSQIVTVNTGLKWCGLGTVFSHKTGSERRGGNVQTFWFR